MYLEILMTYLFKTHCIGGLQSTSYLRLSTIPHNSRRLCAISLTLLKQEPKNGG